MPRSDDPIVILGAGLSGLSFACALLDRDVHQQIVIVDRRTDFVRDRTWCSWLMPGMPFSQAITHRWQRWQILTAQRDVVGQSRRHPYVHLDAVRIYEEAFECLAAAGDQIELLLGEAVIGLNSVGDCAVRTDRRTIEAAAIFDALGPNSPLGSRPAGDVEFAQRFVGWEVEVDRPVFDPDSVTLMDFRPHTGPGATFVYVLPFSTTHALIEHTSIEPRDAPAVDRDRALREELSKNLRAGDWQVLRREHAVLAMSTATYPTNRGPGVITLGAAAGAIRPSSGYAFSRIQNHVDRIAANFVSQQPPPDRLALRRHDALDQIFLRALNSGADAAPLFASLGDVPGDTFARFMVDASTVRDELAIATVLPTRLMLGAAARWLRASIR